MNFSRRTLTAAGTIVFTHPSMIHDLPDVSQQTVQAYEVGPRSIPVSTLRLLAKTLDVSLDVLLAEGEHAPRKRGPVPQVQRQLERISALPKPKQRAVMDVIEALLAQQGR